ncbi:MAG: hypothetical protein M1818_005206 [Claussenomyces sp. TS43310]|nr:MAG: hypothetical protein M1818_005206 [Claussenomyces sp. TS43310]
MATSPSTPPRATSIHMPPTPKHGWEDPYEPYSPRRRSARVSMQRAPREKRTPPPQSSSHTPHTSRSPPSTAKKVTSINMPASPPLTITKKRTSASRDSRRVSGALNEDSAASAAVALGLPSKKSEMETLRSSTATRNHSMLPTPDKTPRKRPSQAAPGISSIARNLFPVRPENIEEVMPSPRKKNKNHSNYTLDSSGTEEPPIEIFTDSHDRVPEVDMSADNPFYGVDAAVPEPVKRSSRRKKIAVPGEGEQTVEEAASREDGLIYVFRGKKIFRKFTDTEVGATSRLSEDASADELDRELDATVPARLRGPLTRSSIKPRLLFATAKQVAMKEKLNTSIHDKVDEEEAVTDIEESSHDLSTPTNLSAEFASTPKAPKFAPASPPTTVRTTRSKKVELTSPSAHHDEDSDTGVTRRQGGKVSSFNGWKRTKSSVPGHGKKREGDPITRSGGDMTKRQRGGRAV